MEFGTWLTEQRHEAGLTQRELAKKCGLSAGYIALLERGTSEPPPLKTCRRLARALNLDWKEARQRSIATRLEAWLRREGCSGLPDDELLDIARRIASASR